MDSFTPLRGGALETAWFDPTAHFADLIIRVDEGGESRRYRASFRRVVEFSFTDSSYARTEPWHYADIAEIYDEAGSNGEHVTELVLWSEDSTLKIRSSGIEITEIGDAPPA